MSETAPRVSIIVPTLNEAPNLTPLAERIAAAMQGQRYELLIVDDASTDNTSQICAELAKTYPLRLIVRDCPKDGLSGAVLRGIEQSTASRILVMDADLQHPPEKIPELLAALDSGADVAIGSRYIAGGSMAEKWSIFRRINSWVATVLARPFAGRLSDPMSGFFALDRLTFNRAERLAPLGYKIALELICKCRVSNVREVPIHFAQRVAGESKLSFKQQFRYLEHLSRLYDFSYPRLSPMLKFAIVTGLAWGIGWVIFALSMHTMMPAPQAVMIAYGSAIGVTAVFHARYVRTQREFLVDRHPWRDFVISSLAEWIACGIVVAYVSWRIQRPRSIELFALPFAAALLVRYILRKEFLLDVRGLRHDLRAKDVA